jgi:hypothetical protein
VAFHGLPWLLRILRPLPDLGPVPVLAVHSVQVEVLAVQRVQAAQPVAVERELAGAAVELLAAGVLFDYQH